MEVVGRVESARRVSMSEYEHHPRRVEGITRKRGRGWRRNSTKVVGKTQSGSSEGLKCFSLEWGTQSSLAAPTRCMTSVSRAVTWAWPFLLLARASVMFLDNSVGTRGVYHLSFLSMHGEVTESSTCWLHVRRDLRKHLTSSASMIVSWCQSPCHDEPCDAGYGNCWV